MINSRYRHYLIIPLVIIIILLLSGVLIIYADNRTSNSFDIKSDISTTTNFFGQKENTSKVLTKNEDELITKGYKLVSKSDILALYVKEETFEIAVYDYNAQYTWYSSYASIDSENYTQGVKDIITSGVTIECYDSTTLNEITKYSSNKTDTSITYQYVEGGLRAKLNFITVGISFDVEILLEDDKVTTRMIIDSLVEVPYKTIAMKYAKEYKLKSVTLFPYLGCENYKINGYALIPDGSGALIRFTDLAYDTAYIKRIYGQDLGISNETTSNYLKNQNDITIPVYGINHGYNQAAFLARCDEGVGSTEIRSYPYMYSNINLNRTFFKYFVREKFTINVTNASGAKLTIINSDPYPNDYHVIYTFLSNDSANYTGMAKKYKESLDLNKKSKINNINLKLDVICQDYKKGLFGKNYITMTNYNDILTIIKDLALNNINNLELNLIGLYNHGYFDNTLTKPKIDFALGGKKDYYNLIEYIENKDIDMFYYNNPLVATTNSLAKKTIKKTNLDVFEYTFKSSIEQTGRYILPNKISEYFLKYEEVYNKLKLTNFTFSDIGNTSFSYRYQSNSYSRSEMINEVIEQVEKIKSFNDAYKIGLITPNDYLYTYITSYYDANYESSKYAFITDSIPFISLILSGYVNMYAPYTNYISDYDLFALRLIEYNLYPSFIITKKETSLLRYTNYEYLFTTEFNLWKNEIIKIYNQVNHPLSKVANSEIISHQYIDDGIVKVSYDNGFSIYINYSNINYIIPGTTEVISSKSYIVKGGK